MKAKITVTTEDGVLVESWSDDEIGDLNKPMARQALMLDIAEAVAYAREQPGPKTGTLERGAQ